MPAGGQSCQCDEHEKHTWHCRWSLPSILTLDKGQQIELCVESSQMQEQSVQRPHLLLVLCLCNFCCLQPVSILRFQSQACQLLLLALFTLIIPLLGTITLVTAIVSSLGSTASINILSASCSRAIVHGNNFGYSVADTRHLMLSRLAADSTTAPYSCYLQLQARSALAGCRACNSPAASCVLQ